MHWLTELPLWSVVPLGTTAFVGYLYSEAAYEDEFDGEAASFLLFVWCIATLPALLVAWLK